MKNSVSALLRSAAVLTAGCMLGLAAQAADVAPAVMKGCTDHEAKNDPAACRHESGAAKEEAKRGNLTSPGAKAQDNAADRCRSLTGGQKTDCLTRMSGGGTSSTTTSGSVESGGVIRETTTTTTTVPAKP